MPQSALSLTRPAAGSSAATGPVSPGPGVASWLRHPSVLLAVILTAQMMVVLDATIVNVALPHIQEDLGFSTSALSWVLNAYILTFGGFMLLGARAGDLFGRRRVFLLGIAIFTVSSLLGGLAVSGWALLAARGVQGVGAALAAPCALSLLTTAFPEGAAAGAGHRPLHDGLRRGRRDRPRPGRPPHPVGLVALGHVRERPHRDRGLARRPSRARRDRAPERSLRPARRDRLHRRRERRGARPRRGRSEGMDERPDAGAPRRRHHRVRLLPASREHGRPSRSCPCGCSRTPPATRPMPHAACSTRGSSASSTSWPSSSRTCRGTARCVPGWRSCRCRLQCSSPRS